MKAVDRGKKLRGQGAGELMGHDAMGAGGVWVLIIGIVAGAGLLAGLGSLLVEQYNTRKIKEVFTLALQCDGLMMARLTEISERLGEAAEVIGDMTARLLAAEIRAAELEGGIDGVNQAAAQEIGALAAAVVEIQAELGLMRGRAAEQN
jgi:hypothetical protein